MESESVPKDLSACAEILYFDYRDSLRSYEQYASIAFTYIPFLHICLVLQYYLSKTSNCQAFTRTVLQYYLAMREGLSIGLNERNLLNLHGN